MVVQKGGRTSLTNQGNHGENQLTPRRSAAEKAAKTRAETKARKDAEKKAKEDAKKSRA